MIAMREITDEKGRRWRCQMHPIIPNQLVAECLDATTPTGKPILLGLRSDWMTMTPEELLRRILLAESGE